MAMAAFKPATSNGKIMYTVHTDRLGGTNVVTDQGGEVTEVTDYYPFGSLRIASAAGGRKNGTRFCAIIPAQIWAMTSHLSEGACRGGDIT